MASKLTVVISQAQGKNPAKRQLEEELATRLLLEPGIDVSVVPHVYDMPADHTGFLFLRSVPGHLVLLGWLYPRALRWVLDRQGVRGQEGISLLVPDDDDGDVDEEPAEPQGIGSVNVPRRRIYTIDLRTSNQVSQYLDEIRRIRDENNQALVSLDLLGWIGGSPTQPQMERYLRADVDSGQRSDVGSPSSEINRPPSGNGELPSTRDAQRSLLDVPSAAGGLHDFTAQETGRRWYPVIDYSRCTNCMECVDFCLFGVYGVDTLDRILVEAQDNCKKGCPACSRVCPENAIIFPQHKTPAIAGAEGEVAGLKIDLSQLFGGPGKDALELAVAERDIELLRDGRSAVGMSIGIPKRQAHDQNRAKDELDLLMDSLDALEA